VKPVRSAAWRPIAHGAYVQWGGRDPLRGTDPYLVWADGTQFSGYGGIPADGKLATLIQLRAGRTVNDLLQARVGVTREDVPGCYEPVTGLSCFTAWVGPTFFRQLGKGLKDIVLRAQICLPVIPERPRFRPIPAPRCGAPVQRSIGRKTLVGVIDDGCAFAHYHLRDSRGRTRIRHFWDQDDLGAFRLQGAVPVDFGRGHEIAGDALQAFIDGFVRHGALDEDACYQAAGYDRLMHAATHGAHVTDVFAGEVPVGSRIGDAEVPPTWAAADDRAAGDDTGIVFVQLPRACLQDPSGGWLDVHVLDALHYILSCADGTAERIVVNLSFGPMRGPGDGSALLEQAFAELLAREPRLRLVLAGGNAFMARGRGVVPLAPGQSCTLHWQVMPGDETPSFLQVWTPLDSGVTVAVAPPGHEPGEPVAPGDAAVWPATEAPAAAVVYPEQSARGTNSRLALIALRPTLTFECTPGSDAPAGLWRIDLKNVGQDAVTAQVWVDRDDFNLGTMIRGRQSHLVDPLYDPLKYLRPARDDAPGTQAVVRRRGTLTGIANGRTTLVAAGYRDSDGKHVGYSSAGPTLGPRQGPDVAAVTDQARTLPGVLAAGTRGASVVRLVGTSTAAPEFARWHVNGRPTPEPAPGLDPELAGSGLLPPR
jgi:hypothetical protein